MAINPGSDLLADALTAAEPQRAKTAADRFASLAAEDGSSPLAFGEVLVSQSPVPQTGASKLPVTSGGIENRALASGKAGNPYQQFEAAILTSLFELALPHKADSVFGSGLAGEVWKSMLAQSLATEAGKANITGIARELEAKAQRAKSRA
ncbi:MAG: rod-binding protein [Rhodomicrobium sp.]